MTFEQLLYVEVLSHYQSLQKAADVLYISKPGLSLAITELEEELGIRIFDRTSKGSVPTQVGLQLLSSVSDILQSKSKLEQMAAFSSGAEKKETIRFRYINTMFKAFMEPFIQNYESRYKSVSYEISRDSTKSIIALVRSGEINAGFIASSDIESEWIKDLSFQPVCYGNIVLGVSKNNDLAAKKPTFEDMKKQRYCLYDDIYHELLFDRLQYFCGPLDLILKTDDHWAINEAVTKLNAVCIGRDLQAVFSREDKNEDLVSVDIGHLINDRFALGWLTNPRISQPEAARALIDEISRGLKK